MTREQYRNYLEGLDYEELLGTMRLNALREEALEYRMIELEDMDDEELLGEDRLLELAEQEIERRLDEYDEEKSSAEEMVDTEESQP